MHIWQFDYVICWHSKHTKTLCLKSVKNRKCLSSLVSMHASGGWC